MYHALLFALPKGKVSVIGIPPPVPTAANPQGEGGRVRSGKKKAHKIKKDPRDTGLVSLGHPAGQTGVYRPVSQGLI